ncbi:MAG: HypC/HybG/HupF family hydrogenase formation chaperone [Candidatus Diapherotrites archaeon]|uniref:HypC/HybG/HupF family hydrogenase formation chaperone n=1 Tax=Candidatus Iainarchaeum sp. TaxID=3101447 RepID=A0A8T4C5L0_9ARCH|nr:HypC/HybG/HupF family hydrogenase formation chaperone [Candidatus Diapherotrites archaeon]
MCLAIPGKIVSIDGKHAIVDFGGIRRKADISFIENPAVGEYLLVHVGFGIQKVDAEVARETYRLLAEVEKEELQRELSNDNQ